MERSTRLRRYSRKDYTQLVDFPVEIVGRDGQVRRYSYDDSIRLYQRRIRSAPIRYDDTELIAAESRHCRQRIDQLRRSYIERFGWGGLREGLGNGLLATTYAAEAISFLRRAFPGERDLAGALSFTVIDSSDGDLVWLRNDDGSRTWFLYLYRLDGEGPPGAREAWRAQLRHLAAQPRAEGVERLFSVHEGPDVGMLLSGTGPWEGPPVVYPEPVAEEGLAEDADFWLLGQRALHDGAVAEAVRLLEVGMEQAPLRRALAQGAALLALLDNQPERAEYAARYGRVAHPEDPLLAYLLGVSLARGGRYEEAGRVLDSLSGGSARDAHLSVLQALLDVRRVRPVRALRAILRARHGPLSGPAERCRRGVLTLYTPPPAAAAGAFGTIGLWAVFAPGGTVGLTVPLLGAAFMVLLATGLSLLLLRTWATRVLSGRGPAEARLVSLELMPRERPADAEN